MSNKYKSANRRIVQYDDLGRRGWYVGYLEDVGHSRIRFVRTNGPFWTKTAAYQAVEELNSREWWRNQGRAAP
jgi:hypothetical protein